MTPTPRIAITATAAGVTRTATRGGRSTASLATLITRTIGSTATTRATVVLIASAATTAAAVVIVVVLVATTVVSITAAAGTTGRALFPPDLVFELLEGGFVAAI